MGADLRPIAAHPVSSAYNVVTSRSTTGQVTFQHRPELHPPPSHESPPEQGEHRPNYHGCTYSARDRALQLRRWNPLANTVSLAHIREIETQVDNFTLAAATPPTARGASLARSYFHLLDRLRNLAEALNEACSAQEYLSQQPIPHDRYWPFPQFITSAADPTRSYIDLVILTALGTRLQNIRGILIRANDHANHTWHGTPTQPQTYPREQVHRRNAAEVEYDSPAAGM